MIGFGNDHTGVELKKYLMAHLVEKGYECVDYGAGEGEKVDYPEPGRKVAEALVRGEIDRGVLIWQRIRCPVFGQPFVPNRLRHRRRCSIIIAISLQ